MKVLLLAFLVLSVPLSGFSQNKDEKPYQYTVDLTNVVDDKLHVELVPPDLDGKEVIFYFPKVVPGTYAIADYGRYVTNLKAYDKKGKLLPVEKKDDNTWLIKKANKVSKIDYWIDDTWDTATKGPEIFWPAGTNIEDKTNFVINSGGFFGYFKGLTEPDFQINVIRPKDLYGSTGLIPVESGAPLKTITTEKSPDPGKVVDVYRATDYDQLIDSPLMYAKPDTAVIHVANTEVLIGAYSPNKEITAKEIAASIREVLMAQKEFLGGKLPVDKYAFIFYFTDKPILSYGALEHSYSSFYYMPEMTIKQMVEQLREFAAHEFFHIVTPLTVHSEQIANFDFNDPKMSKHLWLYEGLTEYHAGLVQVQYGLMSLDEFIQFIRERMLTSDQFKNDVPFTDISKYTLDKYHDQYYNVYQKGALIGLCLDLKLRKLSGGKFGTRNLLLKLSEKFGKEKAFPDDKLFDIITEMTYPEIGEFFKRYVSGKGDELDSSATRKVEPLPFEEVFDDVGIIYAAEHTFKDYSLGIDSPDLGITQVDSVARIQIATTAHLNELGKALGFQEGDILIKVNGEEFPEIGSPDFGAFIQQQLMSLEEGQDLSYTVLRKDSNGDTKETILTAPVEKVEITQEHLLAPNPQATPEELALRKSWLKPTE
ncbi:MAG TPA: peptidase M61 [Chryseosolibacter sp.]|jgi:predicted metalloprotease with PDZ domain|nr:peptidase M61 [Chryseosolibacter sp.]